MLFNITYLNMNIFRREIKANGKALFFWCLGMVGLILSGMAKYGVGLNSGTPINAVFDIMPRSMQALFGFTGLDITRISGFFGVLYPFILLTAAIHAVLLGTDIVVKEERNKTSEFLYVKPVSRTQVLTEKIFVALVNVLIVAVTTFGSSALIINNFNAGEQFVAGLTRLMVGMFVVQLLFLAVGIVTASSVNNPKRASGISSGVMFGTYFLSLFLAVANHPAWVEIFTPFMYFKQSVLLYKPELPVGYILFSLALTAICIAVAYKRMGERDLRV
jgi:ABC-2 type transport system permease protein